MKSQVFSHIVFGLLIILLSMSNLAYAQRTAGVQVGDWVEYTVTANLQGDPFGPFGNVTGPFDNVTSLMLIVVDVVDTNVTLDMHMYYENGSDAIETAWVDVDTGNGTGPQGWLIAANLSSGDQIYTGDASMFGEMTINETVNREYLGGTVEVNHFILNFTAPPNPFMNASTLLDYYWFKDSGFAAEVNMSIMMELMGNKTLTEISADIIDIIPEFPTSLAPFFAIATITIIITYIKTRKTHTRLIP